MVARSSDSVRLYVKELAPAGVLAWLERIAWPGPRAPLERLMDDLGPLVRSFGLGVEFGDAVSPRIGLECYRRSSDWASFLDRLVELGLSTAEKRAGSLSWPGIDREPSGDAPWPEHLARASGFLGARARAFLERSLILVKIVLGSRGAIGAKMYYWAAYGWEESG